MRDVIRDQKYKSGNAIPFAFNEGDHAVKSDGDYVFAGIVVACFRKRSGSPRYVVENDDGVLMIMNGLQIKSPSEGEG